MSTSVVSHLTDHTLLLVGVFQRKSHFFSCFVCFVAACCQTGAPSHVHGLLAFNLNRPNNNFSDLVTDFVQVTAVGKFCEKSLSKFCALLSLE